MPRETLAARILHKLSYRETERQPRCSLRLIVLRGSTQACPHKRVREIAEPDHL